METPDDPRPPRLPESSDLVALCRALNAREAHYVVIGGLAMAYQANQFAAHAITRSPRA